MNPVSYKRKQPGSWAPPNRMAWATDNRIIGFRALGQDNGFRIGNRMPGADANPCLAFAAMLAAGMAGVRERLPSSLRDAAELFANSRLARTVFGEAVVEFYVHYALLENDAFNNAVTDWDKLRYFERI